MTIKSSYIAAASAISALILTACGGGGSGGGANGTVGGTGGITGTPTTFAGKVIDGYIKGATVCLDLNSNNVCDSGEPSAITGSDGSYSISYSGSTTGLQIVATVPVGAVDADTGPITKPYTLLAPSSSPSAITPLTTLVSSVVNAGLGNITPAEAETSVKASLGISKPILGYDFKSAGDTTTQNVAQVTASAIASASETIKTNTAISDAKIVQIAADQVLKNVLPQVVIAGATSATASSIATSTSSIVTGQLANINTTNLAGQSSITAMAETLRSGIVTMEVGYGRYIDSITSAISTYTNFVAANSIQFDVSNTLTAPIKSIKVYANNNWNDEYRTGEDWIYDGGTWSLRLKLGSDGTGPTKATASQNCLIVPESSNGAVNIKYCLTERDVGGKTISSLVQNLCTSDLSSSGTLINGCSQTATFPTNSKIYDLTQIVNTTVGASTTSKLPGILNYAGEFVMYASTDSGYTGHCTGPALQTNNWKCPTNGSIFDYITYSTNSNHIDFAGANCNIEFKIKSYDSSAKQGVIAWSYNSAGCSSPAAFAESETTQFEIISMGGKDLMMIIKPSIYRVNNIAEISSYGFLASITSTNNLTGIYFGSFLPANTLISNAFDGNYIGMSKVSNRTAFDAIIAQRQYKPYPYPN